MHQFSKQQMNRLQAIAQGMGLRNWQEALDLAIEQVAAEFMVEFDRREAEHLEARRTAWAKRRKSRRLGSSTRSGRA